MLKMIVKKVRRTWFTILNNIKLSKGSGGAEDDMKQGSGSRQFNFLDRQQIYVQGIPRLPHSEPLSKSLKPPQLLPRSLK